MVPIPTHFWTLFVSLKHSHSSIRSFQVVADNLSEEQMDGIKEIFDMMDTDKNGNLSFEELKHGFHLIGHAVTDPDVKMLIEAVSM